MITLLSKIFIFQSVIIRSLLVFEDWLLTFRTREGKVVSSVYQLDASMPSTTVSSLLLFGFGTSCRLTTLCPLPSRHPSLDWQAFRRLRHQYKDIHPVFICTFYNMFLSAGETCICRLLPALRAHLPCTTLLNSEECVLLEEKDCLQTV